MESVDYLAKNLLYILCKYGVLISAQVGTFDRKNTVQKYHASEPLNLLKHSVYFLTPA